VPDLAPHIASVPASGIRRIHELAGDLEAQGVTGLIRLAVGEPDVPVAPHIGEAARSAWTADETNYTPNGGIRRLREAIVAKLERENNVQVELEQVWVTVGATQALHQAMGLVLDSGDAVLVPDPGYTTFTMNARMLQADPVPYRLRVENDFLPDFDELERLVGPSTRAIIVNSPSNPLGAVFPKPVLEDLLAFARRHDLWVINDEVYERFVYGVQHTSIASLDRDDRVLSVYSFSKTYAMTGIRVGYLVTPPGFTDVMRTVQEAAISCVNTPGQFAALAAIEGPQSAVDEALEHYRGNLEAAAALLTDKGIRYLVPNGAFYLWVDVSHASGGDVAGWAERLLLEQSVAVAPGSAFGRTGEGWIRLCAAAKRETLLEGIRRLPNTARA
jgi:aspartate aminotransferase